MLWILSKEDPIKGEVFRYVLLVNLMLVAFNLIPAFPMDGGRVLRALLSSWLGRVRATQIAAGLGRAAGPGLRSLINLVNGNLSLVALAAFVYVVAGMELAGVLIEENQRRYYQSGDDGIWTAPAGLSVDTARDGCLAACADRGSRAAREFAAMELTPVVELGVAEAYALLTEHFGRERPAAVGCDRKRGLGPGPICSAGSPRFPAEAAGRGAGMLLRGRMGGAIDVCACSGFLDR